MRQDPDFDLPPDFHPEPWEPVSPRNEWLILIGALLFVAIEGYVIYRVLT